MPPLCATSFLWMYRFERRTDRTRVCSRQRDRGVLPGFVRPLAAPRRLFVVWTRSLQDLPPGDGRFLRPRTLAASLRDILRAAPSYIGIGIFHELKLNHTVGSLNFSERTGSVARRRYKIFLGRQCVSLPQAAGAGVSTRSSTSHGAEACGVGADAVTAHSCHLLAWLFSVSLVVFSLTSSGSVYHGHVNCRSVSWRR